MADYTPRDRGKERLASAEDAARNIPPPRGSLLGHPRPRLPPATLRALPSGPVPARPRPIRPRPRLPRVAAERPPTSIAREIFPRVRSDAGEAVLPVAHSACQ